MNIFKLKSLLVVAILALSFSFVSCAGTEEPEVYDSSDGANEKYD